MNHSPVAEAAAVAALLHRLTASTDVAIALPDGVVRLAPTGASTLATLLAEIEAAPRHHDRPADASVASGPTVTFHTRPDDDLMRERLAVTRAALRSDPHTPLARISVVGPAERRILLGFNPAPTPAPATPVHETICRQAALTPDAVAMRADDGEWTYRRLLDDAATVAGRLRDAGVGPGSVVALCAERGPQTVIAVLAVLLSGAAYLPLDPSHPVARLDAMLDAAGARIVLADKAAVPLFPPRPHLSVRTLSAESDGGREDVDPVDWRGYSAPAAVVDGLCYVIFTSGSTGQPKGVQMTHASLANRLAWMQDEYRLGGTDVVLLKTPYTFDVSVWELLWAFSAGACLVVAPPDAHRDPAAIAEIVVRDRVTTVHFVPSMLSLFTSEPRVADCTSLRLVICSGEALPPKVVNRLTTALPDVEVHNLYGPTEAAIDVTSWRCRRPEPDSGVPIGFPISNVRAYVLDDNGELAPVGTPGELVLGGRCLAAGYAGRPDLTAERFTQTTVAGHTERVYHTGDRAWWSPDGALNYVGRIDTQVKIRGQRVELGEIEAVVALHPAVDNAVVLYRDDLGAVPALVAYMVLDRGVVSAPTGRELRAFLGERLPAFMIPRRFVVMATIPTTANGKADRRTLPKPATGRRT